MVWLTKPPLGTQLDWSNPLNQGLAAFWLFNEGTGDKVYDISGNNNTGTLTNMAFPSTTTSGWNPGRLGPAIAFDGSDDNIDIYPVVFPSSQTIFTVQAWIKTTNTAFLANVVGGTTNTASGFISVLNGYVQWYDGVAWRLSTTLISDGIWHHLVFVFNAGTFSIYVDGKQEYSGAAGTYTYGSAFSKIGNHVSLSRYLNGSIDEVRIWGRALSPSEIQEIYINPYGMFLEEGICSEITCTLEIL